jgi:hypothetical protein
MEREMFLAYLHHTGEISALVHLIRFQGNDMHANRAIADEKKARCLHNNHAKTMDLDHIGNSSFHGTGDVLDRFPFATLTERVVSFLERYNPSICGFG